MSTAFRGTPGVYAGNSFVQRQLFTNPSQVEYASTNAFIDGNLTSDTTSSPVNLLQAGLLLGKITASGKLRNSIIGLTAAAVVAGTVTGITVPAAVATEVARLISVTGGNVSLKVVGPPTAAGTVATTTITATAAAGTSITITSATLPAYVIGSLITPADGSETVIVPFSFPYGVSVLEEGTSVRIDQPLRLHPRKGDIDVTRVVNYPADASLKAYVKGQLKAASGMFTFSDDR
ncbi:MAG TPA: hypothetical protein VF595_04175 [Tepidisphaeraceae bacterium]